MARELSGSKDGDRPPGATPRPLARVPGSVSFRSSRPRCSDTHGTVTRIHAAVDADNIDRRARSIRCGPSIVLGPYHTLILWP